jgi:hypothetical protein
LLYAVVAAETHLFAKPLLSKVCCVFAYLAFVAQQRVLMPRYIATLCVLLTYPFLVLQDLAVLRRAGAEDYILSFPGLEVAVVLLKQVLPSIRRPRVLRGLRILLIRTTTSLVPIKVIAT